MLLKTTWVGDSVCLDNLLDCFLSVGYLKGKTFLGIIFMLKFVFVVGKTMIQPSQKKPIFLINF